MAVAVRTFVVLVIGEILSVVFTFFHVVFERPFVLEAIETLFGLGFVQMVS